MKPLTETSLPRALEVLESIAARKGTILLEGTRAKAFIGRALSAAMNLEAAMAYIHDRDAASSLYAAAAAQMCLALLLSEMGIEMGDWRAIMRAAKADITEAADGKAGEP